MIKTWILFLLLINNLLFGNVSHLGDIDKINQSLADPFSVPASDYSRNFSVTVARNYDLSPTFDDEETSYETIYGERASTGVFFDNNWYNFTSDIIKAGFHLGLGVMIDSGQGSFEKNSTVDVSSFGRASETYHFTHVPVELGFGLTISLFKYIVPMANINALMMGLYEKRVRDNTDKDQHYGVGFGMSYEVGLSFWMNFLERAAAWLMDYTWSVNNIYMTLKYKGLYTTGNVSYSENITHFGFMFEY